MQQRGEQLQIEVSTSPNAVGRWDVDSEIKAYRDAMGETALERQQRLAREAKDCTCGEQEKADQQAAETNARPRKLHGHQHKPGCNSFVRSQAKLSPKISADEQSARYHADQLRSALDRNRAAEETNERDTSCI